MLNMSSLMVSQYYKPIREGFTEETVYTMQPEV